jgi:hypothetical protein
MSNKAFLDTSILADVVLKGGPFHRNAKAAIAEYDQLLVPGYAVKEFKAGPLRAFRWLHDKVVTTGDWSLAIAAIGSVFKQQNLARTAIEAVAAFESSMTSQLQRDGEISPREARALKAEEARLWLKRQIMRAWRKQARSPFTSTAPLDCYVVAAPVETPDGLIDIAPTRCTIGDCCIARQLREEPTAARALEDTCAALAAKPEMQKRRNVLRKIRRRSTAIDDRDCRYLGDAVFALQCPADAVVLTTNLVDHAPLTAALGKSAVAPRRGDDV